MAAKQRRLGADFLWLVVAVSLSGVIFARAGQIKERVQGGKI